MKTEHPVRVSHLSSTSARKPSEVTLTCCKDRFFQVVLTKEEAFDLAIRLLRAVQELP